MKANDLRIGNLYEPTDDSKEKFKKVTADDLTAWSMGAIYGRPIPITEEWFDIFGFGCVQEFACALDEEAGRHLGIPIDFYNDDGIAALKCMKVHELQNLFHSLTGKELEIKK